LPPSDHGRGLTRSPEPAQWPPALPSAPQRKKTAPPDGTCAACGTSVPWTEVECAFCRLDKLPRTGAGTLVLHWLVFLVAMGLVFGLGYLLTP